MNDLQETLHCAVLFFQVKITGNYWKSLWTILWTLRALPGKLAWKTVWNLLNTIWNFTLKKNIYISQNSLTSYAKLLFPITLFFLLLISFNGYQLNDLQETLHCAVLLLKRSENYWKSLWTVKSCFWKIFMENGLKFAEHYSKRFSEKKIHISKNSFTSYAKLLFLNVSHLSFHYSKFTKQHIKDLFTNSKTFLSIHMCFPLPLTHVFNSHYIQLSILNRFPPISIDRVVDFCIIIDQPDLYANSEISRYWKPVISNQKQLQSFRLYSPIQKRWISHMLCHVSAPYSFGLNTDKKLLIQWEAWQMAN